MLIRTIIGAIVGALIGLGGNYLCMLTGGACPLMNNKIVAIVLWTLIGAMFGVISAGK